MNGIHGLASAVRTAVRCIYAVTGVIWLGALVFAAYRFHQMYTLIPLDAEVLKAEVDSYAATSRATDSEGFTTQSQTQVQGPVVWVRYRFKNRDYTVEVRLDAGGLQLVQDWIARRWKPGTRMRIHIDPDEPGKPVPDLGFHLHTFQICMVLVFIGGVFALLGYGFGRLTMSAFKVLERTLQRPALASVPASRLRGEDLPKPARIAEEDEPLPVPTGTAKGVVGLVCCLASPFFDPLGYIMTVVGLILLWGGSTFPASARLVATALVVPPRIAPLVLSALASPGDLSFVLDLSPPATSSSAWGWYGLLWAICGLVVLLSSRQSNDLLAGAGLRNASPPGLRREGSPFLPMIPALLVLAWATSVLLGSKNQFEWVEAANAGAWDLRHSVKGTVTTFTAGTVASIDGREERDKDKATYHIRFALKGGGAWAMSTRSPSAFGEMKKLAATMELPSGRMLLKFASGGTWTNGHFTLKSRTGTYEAANGNLVELRLDQSGRLSGAETVVGRDGKRLTRSLRAVKVSEEGGIEYRTGAFSRSYGNFEEDGLMLEGTKFSKAGK